ncbi:MAG: response regulator [Spirochaetales bacterium]|nr:response regulator [Spirochaetales bacterium]
MDHNILFVDDEKNILTAMERIFHASPFHLFFAESGEEALEILKVHSVSVIISDMKMPGMSGIELLKRSENYSPYATRIILSGYSDIQDILSAVNDGHVHNYLTKPWENERLKIVLYNGTISYEKNIQLKSLAEELKDKNTQLESMNNSLEETVERRNRELTLRNKVLMGLLEEPDAGKNLTQSLQALERLLEGGDIYLHLAEDFPVEGFANAGPVLPTRIREALGSIKKPSYVNEYFILPLEVKQRPGCYLLISPMDGELRKRIPEIISFSHILKLILQQHSNLQKSRSLMDSIDTLLEGME